MGRCRFEAWDGSSLPVVAPRPRGSTAATSSDPVLFFGGGGPGATGAVGGEWRAVGVIEPLLPKDGVDMSNSARSADPTDAEVRVPAAQKSTDRPPFSEASWNLSLNTIGSSLRHI